jgi:hypothetical protein
MFKWFIDKMVLNDNWTKRGVYMIPKRVIYTNAMDNKYGGYCKYYPFRCEISLRPKYKDDKGILEHEKAHARQYGRLFWIHSGLGMVSGWYRLLIELEAYREQVKAYSYKSSKEYEWIVRALRDKYRLNISENEIRHYADYTFDDLIKGVK